MGLSKVLSVENTDNNGAAVADIKADMGGGDLITASNFGAMGEDSPPLSGDYAITKNIKGAGKSAVVGYVDPKNELKSSQGDKRIYARNSSGQLTAEIWLKNDGSIIITNDNCEFEMQNGGDIVINDNVTITPAGQITCISLTVNGKIMEPHTHPILSGSSQGTTGVNN